MCMDCQEGYLQQDVLRLEGTVEELQGLLTQAYADNEALADRNAFLAGQLGRVNDAVYDIDAILRERA